MPERYIPINKGNYSIESPEREEIFERYRGEGWDEEYRLYRERWTEYPKKQIVSEYPLLVDAELSSLCNLRCPMCYTITEEFKRKVKATLMDFDLFKKIIDEIGQKVPALRLSLRGEPTLHKRFIECIRYAKSKGIKEVSFLTNGSKLSPEYFERIMLAGADWITISVDGLGETYESIRKPIKFDDMLEKIKAAKRMKEQYNSHRPVIKIQSVWPAIRNNPTAYYETFSPYVDLIAFNPLIDYLSKDMDIHYEENFSCPQLYQRLVVGSDGLVMMCANDEENAVIVGDVKNETIYDIWNGERLQRIRNSQKEKKGFMKIPVCRKCYLPRKTEDVERGVVDGMTFIIENYLNRRQVVGT
jgi:radical SAM protein with 4Fe4S-binding SPASM domain